MKFLIETWGCQMNDHDSEKLAGLLAQHGYEQVQELDQADLVLLNTCSIREKAVHKVYTELGRLREIKKERPLLIGVAGCLAQQDQSRVFQRAPQVDFVLGTMALQQLPRLVEEALAGKKRVLDTEDYPDNHLFPPEVMVRRPTAKALVTIMEGCNHACTYCVVPATRGPERSRPFTDILDEVRLLTERGFREVELLGQNVNSYTGGCSFAELLDKVSELEGLEWIRFTTSHPMNFTAQLAQVLVSNPKVAPFLHLPIQSGSDRILRRMRRDYTAADYRERVAMLDPIRDRMVLSTDFIVGFPGETDEDFQATMDILQRVRFDASFSFIYSPRPDTPATRFKDEVPAIVASRRLRELQERQSEITLESHARYVGQEIPVRIESRERLPEGHWLARTASWVNVHLNAPIQANLPFGEQVLVKIRAAGPHFLKAETFP